MGLPPLPATARLAAFTSGPLRLCTYKYTPFPSLYSFNFIPPPRNALCLPFLYLPLLRKQGMNLPPHHLHTLISLPLFSLFSTSSYCCITLCFLSCCCFFPLCYFASCSDLLGGFRTIDIALVQRTAFYEPREPSPTSSRIPRKR